MRLDIRIGPAPGIPVFVRMTALSVTRSCAQGDVLAARADERSKVGLPLALSAYRRTRASVRRTTLKARITQSLRLVRACPREELHFGASRFQGASGNRVEMWEALSAFVTNDG